MTPSGWHLDHIVGYGFVMAFGGLVVWGIVGALVGRRWGADKGIAWALLLWGLGNLTAPVAVAGYMLLDTSTLVLKPTRCDATVDSRNRSYRQLWFTLPGPSERLIQGPRLSGPCDASDGASYPLRLRKDDLASNRSPIASHLDDGESHWAIGVTLGGFGVVGTLIGGLLLGHGRPGKADPAPRREPAAWRTRVGELISWVGLLCFLAAFIGPFVIDGSTERALQFGLRSMGTAMGAFLLAGIVAGTMTGASGLFLLVFSGAMFGFAELARL